MKLQQLRFVCEVASDLNVTAAAARLFTSQSGVSKQIRSLEQELGTPIFVRDGNRFHSLTDAGEEIVATARRMLMDAGQLRDIGATHARSGHRTLSLATTHLHARYTLPRLVAAFADRFSDVRLHLVQVFADEVHDLVLNGTADLGISTKPAPEPLELVRIPLVRTQRCLIARRGHPLLARKRPTLRDISRYPLIVYDSRIGSSSNLLTAFADAGIQPNIVLTAMDADVIKRYVVLGLGVAIVQDIAYDPRVDRHLGATDLAHILEPTTTSLFIRRGKFLRPDMYGLIEALAPAMTEKRVRELIAQSPVADAVTAGRVRTPGGLAAGRRTARTPR